MKKINVGILAASDIAGKVAPTIKQVDRVELMAVASRTQEKADAFAKEQGIAKAYGSYEAMLADSEIDLVYITTPHSHHAQYAKMCIEAGKNVICEKAFTLNAKEAEEVLKLAEEKKLMVCEAIWQRYTPMAKIVKDYIDSGKLGTINTIMTNLGYDVWHRDRLHDRSLGGGALLDVGIYTLNFVDLVMNGEEPESIIVKAEIDKDSKVDRQETILMTYKNGVNATMYNSLINQTDRYAFVYGDKGYIIVDNVNNFERLRFFDNSRNGAAIEDIKAPDMISGYEYEFDSAAKAINEGKLETEECSHEQTLRLMRLMDRIRKEMGVVYDIDNK